MHDRLLGRDYTLVCSSCGLNEAEGEWLYCYGCWYCTDECRAGHVARLGDFRRRLAVLLRLQDDLLALPSSSPTLYQKMKAKRERLQGTWKRHASVEKKRTA